MDRNGTEMAVLSLCRAAEISAGLGGTESKADKPASWQQAPASLQLQEEGLVQTGKCDFSVVINDSPKKGRSKQIQALPKMGHLSPGLFVLGLHRAAHPCEAQQKLPQLGEV